MRFITCFGGGAAVADDSDEAAVAAAARRERQKRRSLASSFLSSVGKKGKKTRKPSPADEETRDSDADSISGRASTASSSVPSSAPLSLSPAPSPRPSSVSSVVLRAFLPRSPKRKARRAAFPVTGVAAFVLCLLMVVLCGKVGATLLTSTALYLVPRLESPAKKTKVVRNKGFFGRNRKQ